MDDQAKFPDWNNRADIKAALKVNLIIALAENGYPPVDRNDTLNAGAQLAQVHMTAASSVPEHHVALHAA